MPCDHHAVELNAVVVDGYIDLAVPGRDLRHGNHEEWDAVKRVRRIFISLRTCAIFSSDWRLAIGALEI